MKRVYVIVEIMDDWNYSYQIKYIFDDLKKATEKLEKLNKESRWNVFELRICEIGKELYKDNELEK